MPKGRITKRAVDGFQCPAGKDRDFLWDDALAGFGVGAFPGGRKVYVVQSRQNGRSRRATIGEHGRLTPDEARSEAKKLLGAVEIGADPIEERRAARAALTFRELAEDFMSKHVEAKRKKRTGEEYRRLLELHVYPAIGARRLVDIRRKDVARLHEAMAATPRAANHALALVSAIWNWAARREEVAAADNPAKGIERYDEQARERFLTSDELARLGDALRLAETDGLPWNVDETGPGAKHLANEGSRRRLLDPFAVAAIRLLV